MTKTTHTPGPWRYRPQDGNGSRAMVDSEASNSVVAELPYGRGEHIEANARLIAAAPDLLAALRAVEWGGLCDAEEGGYVPCCPFCGVERRDGTHIDCDLAIAIAKTEGRS